MSLSLAQFRFLDRLVRGERLGFRFRSARPLHALVRKGLAHPVLLLGKEPHFEASADGRDRHADIVKRRGAWVARP